MTLLMSHCADNHSEESPVSFCLSFWNVMASAKDQGSYFDGWDATKVLDYWTRYAESVRPYTKRKNYLRVNGQPVLQFGYVHTWAFYEKFGVLPIEIVGAIREGVQCDAYLLATSTPRDVYPFLGPNGFDGFTEYLLHGRGWNDTMLTYRWYWERGIEDAKKYGLQYWTPATSGYNAEAWDTPEYRAGFSHVPTPAQFTAHLLEAKKFAQDNHPHTSPHVLTYSWDEWGESSTVIEPSVSHGTAYLDAFREAAA